jgi:hypothetical protein
MRGLDALARFHADDAPMNFLQIPLEENPMNPNTQLLRQRPAASLSIQREPR